MLVERDRTTDVSMALRGDGPRRLEDQKAGALLAQAIGIVWSNTR